MFLWELVECDDLAGWCEVVSVLGYKSIRVLLHI